MPSYYVLPTPLVLTIRGRDARRYLHARLTNDIRSLAVGGTVGAAALSPQGRCEGLFTVYALEESSFMLVCDGGEHSAIRKAFSRYIVADRVEIQEHSVQEYCVMHLIGTPSGIPLEGILAEIVRPVTDCAYAQLPNGGILAYHRRSRFPGLDIVAPRHYVETLITSLPGWSTLSATEMKSLRFESALPSFPEDLQGELFAEANLSAYVSFQKGCYTGQEVMERIDSQGKVARLICFLEVLAGTPPPIGAPVQGKLGDSSIELGTVYDTALGSTPGTTYVAVRMKNVPNLRMLEIFVHGIRSTILEPKAPLSPDVARS